MRENGEKTCDMGSAMRSTRMGTAIKENSTEESLMGEVSLCGGTVRSMKESSMKGLKKGSGPGKSQNLEPVMWENGRGQDLMVTVSMSQVPIRPKEPSMRENGKMG